MTEDGSFTTKLADIESFNRPRLAKVLVVCAIPVAAAVAATVAGSLALSYGAQAGLTMVLTAVLLVAAFVGIAVLDERLGE